MKQTKKPTYKELEKNLKFSIKILLCSFIGMTILFLTFLCSTIHYAEENNQLKSQLNQTEGKNYSCDFVGAIKPEDTRNCSKVEVKDKLICSVKIYNEKNDTGIYRGYTESCEVIE